MLFAGFRWLVALGSGPCALEVGQPTVRLIELAISRTAAREQVVAQRLVTDACSFLMRVHRSQVSQTVSTATAAVDYVGGVPR